MTYLSIFIFGLVFGLIIMPVLDAIGTWIQNIFGLKSVILQKQAELVDLDVEPKSVHAVGFQVNDDEDKENGDEYDE